MSRLPAAPLPIAELLVAPGAVGLSACPGANPAWNGVRRNLRDDIRRIVARRFDTLLSLLEDDEMDAVSPSLLVACDDAGLPVLRFPIPDMLAPADGPAFDALLADLLGRLRAGGRVLIHCYAGLGRSGLVAAMLLRAAGDTPAAAVEKVRAAQPRAIQSDEQMAFVLTHVVARHG